MFQSHLPFILSRGAAGHFYSYLTQTSLFMRAELLGRLGMIPIKKDNEGKEQKRFSIAYFNSNEFFERLNELILGSGSDVLIIPCQDEEFNQFYT